MVMDITDLGPETDEEYPPTNGEVPPEFSVDDILNAPDYAQLIAVRQSRKAKEYTGKVNSVLKALTFASINADDFPDAAALLHHGPPFSHAMGQLADKNERTAQIIDMITSPSNPTVMAVVTGIALIGQLARNHEDQLKQIPQTRKQARMRRKADRATRSAEPPTFTIKLFRREIPVHLRKRIKVAKFLKGFTAQTQEPAKLARTVFTDPELLKALQKQGYNIVSNDAE
jgi:hypothetical protein